MLNTFQETLQQFAANPNAFFALVGVLILIIAGIYFTHIKFNTRMILHIGLMLALSFILQYIRLYHMPQGGSVTLGSMVPLMLIALAYGPAVGMLTGFLFGMMDLFQDPFILNPVQVLFDYPLPFMAFGVMAYFRKHLIIGATVAMSLRLLCHYISGVAFFAQYAPPTMSPYLYSFIFNITYLLPELIICIIILKILPINRFLQQIRNVSR